MRTCISCSSRGFFRYAYIVKFILIGRLVTLSLGYLGLTLGAGGLLLGLVGIIDFADFAIGLSSGARVFGGMGIAGSLLCALVYAAEDLRK